MQCTHKYLDGYSIIKLINIFNNFTPNKKGNKGRKKKERKSKPVDIIKGKQPVVNSVITANVSHN